MNQPTKTVDVTVTIERDVEYADGLTTAKRETVSGRFTLDECEDWTRAYTVENGPEFYQHVLGRDIRTNDEGNGWMCQIADDVRVVEGEHFDVSIRSSAYHLLCACDSAAPIWKAAYAGRDDGAAKRALRALFAYNDIAHTVDNIDYPDDEESIREIAI